MMMVMKRISVVTAPAFVLALALSAAAQDSNTNLEKKVAELEKKVQALESNPAAKPAEAKLAADDKQLMAIDREDIGVFNRLFADAKVTGFVDTGLTYNLDRPKNGLNGNTGDSSISATPPGLVPAFDGGSVRAFDQKSRSFYIHNAQLDISRLPTKDLKVGYDLELSFGSDANVFGTADSNLTDFFDVQEANVQLLFFEDKLTVTAGKFVTFAGMEVIESVSNSQYSRGLPFLFAIPFTHTGVRASYAAVPDMLTVCVGVNNGWDRAVDNNDAKTGEFMACYTPTKWLSATGVVYYGAEKARAAGFAGTNERGDKRFLADFIVTVKDLESMPGWSFGVNLDLAEEEEVVADPVTGELEDAEWTGFGLYAKWKVNDNFSPSIRYSVLDDKDGYRTALGAGGIKDKKLSEITVTGEFAVAAGTIFRLEIRQDMCDEDFFLDGDKEDDSQTTIGAEVIISF